MLLGREGEGLCLRHDDDVLGFTFWNGGCDLLGCSAVGVPYSDDGRRGGNV